MRRIIPKKTAQPTAEEKGVEDFRQASIEAAVSLVRDRMTFLELAEVLGVKHEFVRCRLTKTPTKLLWTGKAYQVPFAVGVEFVRSILSQRRVVTKRVGVPIQEEATIPYPPTHHFYRLGLPELQEQNRALTEQLTEQLKQLMNARHKKAAEGVEPTSGLESRS